MKTLWWFAALLLAFPRAGLAVCSGTVEPAGLIDIQVRSETRTFVLHQPASYNGRTPVAVVLFFHPYGASSLVMHARANLPKTWPEALIVYPEAMPRVETPERFRKTWQSRPGEFDDRDLTLYDALRQWLREHRCIDDHRVFVMGYSNGGSFASVLACERAAEIAGFAVAAGDISCTPRIPRPMIISHGMHDQTVEYERGFMLATAWSKRNNCAGPPTNWINGCSVAASCSTPVVFCSHQGLHEYDQAFTSQAVALFKSVPGLGDR